MSLGICSMNSPWDVSVRCNELFGKCDVQGDCICQPGYRHDLAFFRYRDCRVPVLYLVITDIILLILFMLCLIYALKHYPGSKALARIVILSVIGGTSFATLLEIILISQNDYLSSYSLVAFLFSSYSFALGGYVSAFSLASPLCKLSRVPEQTIKQGLKVSYVFFRIVNLLPIFVSFQYSDSSIVENDIPWNKCLSATYLIHGIELFVLGYGIVIVGNKMVGTIKEISTDAGSSDIMSKKRKEYVKRVKRYFVFFACFTPVITAILSSQPVINLTTGYIPYSFALFTMNISSLVQFAVFQTKFATSKKIDVSESINHNKHLSNPRVADSQSNVVLPYPHLSVKETQLSNKPT